MAQVTFLGACGTVTGSSSLLAFGDNRFLVDCGLFQGGEELEARNRLPFRFVPGEISAVVLTHAHLDHSGRLPGLVAAGFRGPIYCTKPTRPLAELVLLDSAAIGEEEARYARKKGYSKHANPEPLYTSADARTAIGRLTTFAFDEEHDLAPGVSFRFRRAGHLLGAATVEIAAKGGDGVRRSWCFSGDVGRYGTPILRDPQPPLAPPAALLLESTYGDRLHEKSDPKALLAEIIRRTFARGGTVVVPAFALGRTQEVLYYLSELADESAIDPQAVFIDSPMAIAATEIYREATPEYDDALAALVAGHANPLAPDRFRRCRSVDESKALNERRESAVVVAASGMAEGGRVVHHLIHRLGDARNTVVFTGFQAAGTRGRALLDGAHFVSIHGTRVEVHAEIVQIAGLSAHADADELLRWCRALPAPPQRVFLNHGEEPARKALAAALVEIGFPRPQLPATGDSFPW